MQKHTISGLEKTLEKYLLEVFDTYLSYVHDFNFTGHKEPDTFWDLNIRDSVAPFLENFVEIVDGKNVCDIGTGGGFPGVPLAILAPKASFTLVDSVQKKLDLINEIAKKHDLKNITTVHTRLEEIGQDPAYRESFDVVVAKACAKWTTLLEYALPLVKVGGVFYAYQSDHIRDEIPTSQKVIEELGGEVHDVKNYTLDKDLGERTIATIKKVHPTDAKYPRKVGVPKNRPL